MTTSPAKRPAKKSSVRKAPAKKAAAKRSAGLGAAARQRDLASSAREPGAGLSASPGVVTRRAPEPPDRDASAIARVVPRVEICEVQLVDSTFSRQDDRPLEDSTDILAEPEFGLSGEWELEPDGSRLGCLLSFTTLFPDEEDPPYVISAQFRLLYDLTGGDALAPDDLDQFLYWNAVFNAWPYWREYLTSTLNRAQLPRIVAPVMRMPS